MDNTRNTFASCPRCGTKTKKNGLFTCGTDIFGYGTCKNQKPLACPHCGEARMNPMNYDLFLCGMNRNGKGQCKKPMDKTHPQTAVKHMKPRIRMIFDDDHSPEEVRVILSPPTKDTQTYNEFDNLILVDADEKLGEVNSIHLNCKNLGGKVYEEALLDLIINYEQLKQYYAFPVLFNNKLKKYIELIGQSKIKSHMIKIDKEREAKWGPLYSLVDDLAAKKFATDEAKEKFKNYIQSRDDWKRVITEAIRAVYEEFAQIGSSRVSTVIRQMVCYLTNPQFTEFLNDAVEKKSYDTTTWQILQRAIHDRQQDIPISEFLKGLKAIYNGYLGDGSPSEFRMNVMEHIENICVSADMPAEIRTEGREFIIKIIENDPSEEIKEFAQNFINQIDHPAQKQVAQFVWNDAPVPPADWMVQPAAADMPCQQEYQPVYNDEDAPIPLPNPELINEPLVEGIYWKKMDDAPKWEDEQF